MTALSETNRYRINGVIDTAKPVIENIENICNSAQSWFTYDNTTGKWGVVMNREQTSAYSFTDDNIVGAINVSTRGIEDLYNNMEVSYPDRDLLDVSNTRDHTIPAGLQVANEINNKLSLSYSLISDQTRAQNLAISELYQSRTDLSAAFATNFSMNEVSIGDVIDITNNTYNWTNRLFRVTNIREEDTAEGDIVYVILCSEYRGDIFNHITTRITEDPANGINTIANISGFASISITRDEVSDKPNITFSTTIPGTGSPITGVELWSYRITNPTELANWNNTVLYPDALRAYDLVFTKRPSEEDYYTPGAAWEARTEDLGAGNYLFKLRPVNATTQGAFTDIYATGVTNYAPQVTQGVIAEITSQTIDFAQIPAIVNATEMAAFSGVTLSATPTTFVAVLGPVQNNSRGMTFAWDGLFFDTVVANPQNATSFCKLTIEVFKTRGANPPVLLTNSWGRTSQFGYAVGNNATVSGITFFSPNAYSNGTFLAGDIFTVGVSASVTGVNPAVEVSPTVQLEYYSL